jgi:hypothetical protein
MVVPLSLEGAFAPQTETLFFSQSKTDQETLPSHKTIHRVYNHKRFQKNLISVFRMIIETH